ncbi:hypothetical protein IEQ34_016183 [Dendrobium chrysotoxum]|uniref:Uncharacterized protein n=1 Tax=Dendrobium chrysotoxum TaxID=161865 RepID=A0AAV7FXD7_DENCH|nr:hypothetical protein IEQ34_016183 [Dendrobium chrysotoxum]
MSSFNESFKTLLHVKQAKSKQTRGLFHIITFWMQIAFNPSLSWGEFPAYDVISHGHNHFHSFETQYHYFGSLEPSL